MKTIVKVENLSKKYNLCHSQASYETLRETLARACRRCFNLFLGGKGLSNNKLQQDFWALQEVSFELKRGDRVGIIGRNGAGKSTLLKILSRITEPTKGKIHLFGKVSSLLEVGTGFHPELTGRENIFLNGAILGMSQREIKKKFDEIVAFAEIENFLDIPIKRYSSGMNTRLGFAIASHLDSDLMIVDEVLAVGDIKFQEKCLKKMNELGTQGRTILFVSHSINSVLSLCNKGIWLEKGRLITCEPIVSCVSKYLQTSSEICHNWEGNAENEHIRFCKADLYSKEISKGFFYVGEEAFLNIEFVLKNFTKDLVLGFSVWNTRNQMLSHTYLDALETRFGECSFEKRYKISFVIDTELFHCGEYLIRLESYVANQKKFLDSEVQLKLNVYPREGQSCLKRETKDGISLGNRWTYSP